MIKQSLQTRFARFALTLLIMSFAQLSLAIDTKERLFKGAYLAEESALKINASYLAPTNFNKGKSALSDAETLYKKNKPIDKIQAKLVLAIRHYELASTAAAKANEQLGNALKARSVAMSVDADKYSEKDWSKAEKLMAKAIDLMEDDKKDKALLTADKAIELYKSTELVAIKVEYLQETRQLIQKADDARISKLAPITLRKAKELLATAEVELTENRYDIDLPRSLAQEARYEVKHAFYLYDRIKEIKDKDLTEEQIILESEIPLQKVAAAADVNARFDEGIDPVADNMVLHIETLNQDTQKHKQEIADRDLQISGLNELLNEYAQLYGGVGTSVEDMEKHLAAQAMLRQKATTMESMFTRDEARIFRDSRELYIRLIGLSFDSGTATLNRENYQVLNKVIRALELFPDSHIIVEGHTDSFGSDNGNLILSKNRAESVRRYLNDSTLLTQAQTEAIGYGETRPFANNDTPQGRALNRRIDIRILPAEK